MNRKIWGIVVLVICIISGASYLTVDALTTTLQVAIQLLPTNIGLGDSLSIQANVADYTGTPLNDAIVTATIGDLEIIYFLTERGAGCYEVTVDTPIMMPGAYDITVTVQKEGFALTHTSTTLIIMAQD
jgi:hypothetical protein